MWVFLFPLLVVCGLVVAAEREPRQVYGNRINLQPTPRGYLPPTGPACEPAVIYRTKLQYSTVIIPSTVYNNQVQYLTQTSIRTQPVYTTIYSDVVSTQVVPQLQYQTVVVTRTQDNVQTQYITQPGQVSYFTQTQETVQTQPQFQTQYVTRTQQVPSTFTRIVVSTQVIPQPVFSTIFITQTVTRTQNLPGITQTVQSTQYSTVYSTIVVPGQDNVVTQYVTRTNFITQTITQPGLTQFITSTQFQPVTTTIYSDIAITNTQTQFLTRTQFQQQVTTVVRTQQVPQYNTRTITVPQEVVRTQISTQVVPTTIYSQQVVPSVINLPAQTQYQTVYRTDVRTIQIPGLTRTQYLTQTVFNTNYVTSTVLNKHYVTITSTKTIKPYCGGGYHRPTPGFSPYRRK